MLHLKERTLHFWLFQTSETVLESRSKVTSEGCMHMQAAWRGASSALAAHGCRRALRQRRNGLSAPGTVLSFNSCGGAKEPGSLLAARRERRGAEGEGEAGLVVVATVTKRGPPKAKPASMIVSTVRGRRPYRSSWRACCTPGYLSEPERVGEIGGLLAKGSDF